MGEGRSATAVTVPAAANSRVPSRVVDEDGRAHILLADDDPITRRVLRELLEADGHQVVEAESGQSALHEFRRHTPDLVLLDVHMPDGDGFETCASMRVLDPEELVPIIMLTARDDAQSVERAFQLRASDFISKPFRHRVLQQRVRYALRNRRLDIEVARNRARQQVTLRMARLIFWEWHTRSDKLTWSSESLPTGGEFRRPPQSMHDFLIMVEPTDAARLWRAVDGSCRTGKGFDVEARLSCGDYVVRVLGTPEPSSEGALLLSGALQDVTAERKTEALAQYLTLHDELTGLGNRRGFTEQLTRVLAERQGVRDEQSEPAELREFVLVGWLDITRFRRHDDALGEQVGNMLLALVGRRIRAFVSDGQLVGRVGGDEFAVMLNARDAESARLRFEALLLHLREPFTFPGGEALLSWSAGYTISDGTETDAARLLLDAESAQRAARHSGVMVESGSARNEHAGNAALLLGRERALRRALDEQTFRIVVQPQLEVLTGRVVGVESLLRWRDPEGREVPPSEFAPLLEESELIVEVGEWVLAEACRWQRRWAESGLDVRVAVNLSARQFTDASLLPRFSSIIKDAGVPPQRLEFELTESLAVHRPDFAAEVLSGLRDLGALVAIDDFGVGYSSLSYLVQFPIDTIKLDRSFTNSITTSRSVQAIVRAAVAIADGLGLTTIAEGVESAEQAVRLGELGITELQGYHICRPIPPDELPAFVLRHHQRLPSYKALPGHVAVPIVA